MLEVQVLTRYKFASTDIDYHEHDRCYDSLADAIDGLHITIAADRACQIESESQIIIIGPDWQHRMQMMSTTEAIEYLEEYNQGEK